MNNNPVFPAVTSRRKNGLKRRSLVFRMEEAAAEKDERVSMGWKKRWGWTEERERGGGSEERKRA